MTGIVVLRDVLKSDIPLFFEHQSNAEAVHMAAFPAREWEPFMSHWRKIMADETVINKTILFDGEVAGNVVCFERSGKWEVGYWLGKPFWGRGIATKALVDFLDLLTIRPLYAYAAKHNIASNRVLEKCGFEYIGEADEFSSLGGQVVKGSIWRLM